METLKDIFVPYEIAVQLKEIGFDEPCIFYYDVFKKLMIQTHGTVYWHREESIKIKNYNLDVGDVINLKSAPTWEQVFRWFRNKNIIFEILPIVSIVNKNIKRYIFCVYDLRKETQTIKQDDIGCKTYEQVREQLIYKLIEIYKDGKKDR